MKTVNELCRLGGVTRKTLYYYDKIDLLKPVCRSGKQHSKVYDDSAPDVLRQIKTYQSCGLTLSEIRTVLNRPEECRNILEQALKRLKSEEAEISRQILSLEQMLDESI